MLTAQLPGPRLQDAGLVILILAGLTVAYLTGRSDPPAAPAAAPAVAADEPAPSAENVDPVVHARLMTLRRQVEEAPADTSLLLELARMEHDAHQFESAVATYERLIEAAPAHRQAYLDLAQTLVALGRWDDAQGAMERLLTRYPDDPAGLYNLGAIMANRGDYAAARPIWTRVSAQTSDASLARQATESLAELERLAASGAPPAAASALPSGAAAGALPPGHPPVPGGIETTVITGPPLPE